MSQPFVCSICGVFFESKSKRTPRHRCKGDEWSGKVGTGVTAAGHPDFQDAGVIPVEAGDVDFAVPDEPDEPLPIFKPEAKKATPEPEPEPKEKPKAPPAHPATKGAAAADTNPLPGMLRGIVALTDDHLTTEEAAVIAASMFEGSVEVEASPVKVEMSGWPLLIGIGLLTAALFAKAYMGKARQVIKPKPNPNKEKW